MTKYKVALVEGDGVGPEIIQATVKILQSTGLQFEWEMVELNPKVMQNHPDHLPESLLERIRYNGRALKGPISTPVAHGFIAPSVLLRRQLGLYASIRPAKVLDKSLAVQPDTDVIVVRELTEDLYTGVEETPEPGKSKTPRQADGVCEERHYACHRVSWRSFMFLPWLAT